MTLTPAAIGQRMRDGYQAISSKLKDWELAKAGLLVGVGCDARELLDAELGKLPETDFNGRKQRRAELVKEIEAAIGEHEGIGAPQLNRWMRWAGIYLVVAGPEPQGYGLSQSQLIALEPYFDHEKCQLKPSWASQLEKFKVKLRECVAGGYSAKALSDALDQVAEPQEQPKPCPISPSLPASPTSKPPSSSSPTTTTSSKSDSSKPAEPSSSRKDKSSSSSSPSPTPSSSSPTSSSSKASPPKFSPTPSNTPSTGSPSRPSPGSQQTSAPPAMPNKADLADQAWKLLQDPEILAGVFRRDWKSDLLMTIVDNLIRGSSEKGANSLGLAKMYHRMAPLVRRQYDEVEKEGGGLRLVPKEPVAAA